MVAIKIGDGTDTHATYQYRGTGTVVVEDYDEPEVMLDYRGTSHSYGGFDRFGRVVDQLWRDYGNSQDADRFLYGYDRAGNRTWRENDVAANLATPVHLDELYEYDDLYQLIASDRGNLNGTQDGIVSGTEGLAQDWDLDGLGNWTGFDEDTDGDGSAELSQTRDHNEANELTEIDSSTADVAHDAAGRRTRRAEKSSPMTNESH